MTHRVAEARCSLRCSRKAAEQALAVADAALADEDHERALKFAQKSATLYPSAAAEVVLEKARVMRQAKETLQPLAVLRPSCWSLP